MARLLKFKQTGKSMVEVKIYLNESLGRFQPASYPTVHLANYSLGMSYWDPKIDDTQGITFSAMYSDLLRIYSLLSDPRAPTKLSRPLTVGDLIMLDGTCFSVITDGFLPVGYDTEETITSVLLERMSANEARHTLRKFEARARVDGDRWGAIVDVVRDLCGDVKYCAQSITYIELLMAFAEERDLP